MFLKCSKCSLSVFVVYIMWYKEAFGNLPIVLYGTVLLAVGFAFADMAINRRTFFKNTFVNMLFVFGLVALASGVFVSRDREFFSSMIMSYFSFAIVCWCSTYVCIKGGSTQWLLRAMLLAAILCALQTIFFGVDYKTEVIVTTMSEDNNPNVLGLMMLIGVFTIISEEQRIKRFFVLKLGIVMAFLYVILLCGSRKSLICAAILMLFWIIGILKSEKRFSTRKLMLILAFFAAILVGVSYIVNEYLDSASFERLLLLFEEDGSVDTRWTMYQDAFKFWKEHPIFGIGFGQYQIWSSFGKYSHSSYAEILACTGIVGFLIFFVPILKMLIKSIGLAFQKQVSSRYNVWMCLLVLVIELVLGIGQIYIYEISHLLLLSWLSISIDRYANEREAILPMATEKELL